MDLRKSQVMFQILRGEGDCLWMALRPVFWNWPLVNDAFDSVSLDVIKPTDECLSKTLVANIIALSRN
jgi:hypothetical protein